MRHYKYEIFSVSPKGKMKKKGEVMAFNLGDAITLFGKAHEGDVIMNERGVHYRFDGLNVEPWTPWF